MKISKRLMDIVLYIKDTREDNTSQSQEMGGTGKWAKRMGDGTYIGGDDDYLVVLATDDDVEVLIDGEIFDASKVKKAASAHTRQPIND